jgi:hypothetical protein
MSFYPQTYQEAFDRMHAGPIPKETWTPVRYVHEDTFCWFCAREIPRAKPGATKGTRGTKAWFCPERRVLECIPCRSEAMRADEASLAEKGTHEDPDLDGRDRAAAV